MRSQKPFATSLLQTSTLHRRHQLELVAVSQRRRAIGQLPIAADDQAAVPRRAERRQQVVDRATGWQLDPPLPLAATERARQLGIQSYCNSYPHGALRTPSALGWAPVP